MVDVADGDYVQVALTYECHASHVRMKARRRDAVIEGQTSSTCCQNEKNLKMSTALRSRHGRAQYLMTLKYLAWNAEVVEVDGNGSSVMKAWTV